MIVKPRIHHESAVVFLAAAALAAALGFYSLALGYAVVAITTRGAN